VRFVTRLDDAYLALTLPEAEPSAAGAAALVALGACVGARRRR
jgi:MYXO-CTERM domain-containing protein